MSNQIDKSINYLEQRKNIRNIYQTPTIYQCNLVDLPLTAPGNAVTFLQTTADNSHGFFSYNPATGIFTVNKLGYYFINVNASVTSLGDSNARLCFTSGVGTLLSSFAYSACDALAGEVMPINLIGIAKFSQGDTFRIFGSSVGGFCSLRNGSVSIPPAKVSIVAC